MYIEIVTPDTTVFEGEVLSVRIPGKKGSFQVLKDHAAIVSTIEKGPVTIFKTDNTEESFNADGGVVEMQNNKIILLVEKILD